MYFVLSNAKLLDASQRVPLWPLWQGVLSDRQPATARGRDARGSQVTMCRVPSDVPPQERADQTQLVTWSSTVPLQPL